MFRKTVLCMHTHTHTNTHTNTPPTHTHTHKHTHTRMHSRTHARLEMHIQRGKVLATPHPPYPSDIIQSVESNEDIGCQRNGMRQFYTLLGLLQGGLKGTEIVFLHPVNHDGYIRVKNTFYQNAINANSNSFPTEASTGNAHQCTSSSFIDKFVRTSNNSNCME